MIGFFAFPIMQKSRQFIIGSSDGRTRYFRVVSRTAGKRVLFGDDERDTFRKIVFKQLKFSGLRALAWCFMGGAGDFGWSGFAV